MKFFKWYIPEKWSPWIVLGLFAFLATFTWWITRSNSEQKPERVLHDRLERLLNGPDELIYLSSTPSRIELEFYFEVLTESLAAFEAQMLVADILETVAESEVEYSTIILTGYSPFADAAGAVSRVKVVETVYFHSTINGIQWSTFDKTRILDLANSKHIHPAFQP